MTSVSLSNLRNVHDAQTRYVDAGAGTFKAADAGGWAGKAINWLKELFRPGLVRQENVQAYQAAKREFIAAGGDTGQASALFDGKIAAKARFTPADIVPTLKFLADRSLAPADEASVSGDIDGRAADPSLLVANPVDASHRIDRAFLVDCGRETFSLDGEAVDGSSQTAALRSFAQIAQAKGISAQDLTMISRFAHQQTAHSFCNHVQHPANAKFVTAGGEALMPVFSTGAAGGGGQHSIDITSRGQGTYAIHFKQQGSVQATINGTDFQTNTEVDRERSMFVADFSIVVGPDPATGAPAVLAFERARYGAHVYDTEGGRIL